jgi:hypothetical protein
LQYILISRVKIPTISPEDLLQVKKRFFNLLTLEFETYFCSRNQLGSIKTNINNETNFLFLLKVKVDIRQMWNCPAISLL